MINQIQALNSKDLCVNIVLDLNKYIKAASYEENRELYYLLEKHKSEIKKHIYTLEEIIKDYEESGE